MIYLTEVLDTGQRKGKEGGALVSKKAILTLLVSALPPLMGASGS